MAQFLTANKRPLALGSALCFAFLVALQLLTTTPPPPTFEGCDAMAEPGRLLLNLSSPLHTHWHPLDTEFCPPLPEYLPALWELAYGPRPLPTNRLVDYSSTYHTFQPDAVAPSPHPARVNDTVSDPVAFLRYRNAKRGRVPTALILGDSVDRNSLVHFCQLFKRNVSISHYHDITLHPPGAMVADPTTSHGPPFDGWDQRGLPHLCEIPLYENVASPVRSGEQIAMRIVNGFHYGMDALDEFDAPSHPDWHAPGRIEVRIDELVLPFLDQMGGVDAIDLIVLHSGMWDIALFGMQDDKTKWSLTTPLTPEQLAWWQERMRRTIYHVRETFPKARIVYRKLHRTDDSVVGTQYITNLYVARFRSQTQFLDD